MAKKHYNNDDVDERGVVRAGGRVRVPLTLMDSMDAIQREVAADHVADRPRVRAFDGTDLGLHRPGVRVVDERSYDPLVVRGAKRDATDIYSQYDFEKSREYLSPEARLASAKAVAEEDPYREGRADPSDPRSKMWRELQSGSPFTNRSPTDGKAMSAYARRQEEKPDEAEEEPDEAEAGEEKTKRRDVPDGVADLRAQHQAVTDAAYRASDEEMQNAWKGK